MADDTGGFTLTAPDDTGGFRLPVTSKGKWTPSADILAQDGTYWVPPKDYLKWLPPLAPEAFSDRQGKSLIKSVDQGDPIDQAPSITVRDGKIANYDGRHRAQLAADEGVDLIPVRVKGQLPTDDANIPLVPDKTRADWKYQPTRQPVGQPKTWGELGRKWIEEGALTAPLRGAADIGQQALGEKPQSSRTQPDELAALTLGLRAAPGGGAFGPRTMPETVVPTPATAAIESGFTLPPGMTDRPGFMSNLLSGWAGKIKTAQRASEKNEAVTTALAMKALDLPEGAPLTEGTFRTIRQEAGKAYEEIKSAIPKVTLDDQFLNDVVNLGGARNNAAGEFTQLLKRPDIDALKDGLLEKTEYTPSAAIEAVKQLRADAKTNLKNFLDPGKRALGQAQRDAADALDSVVERNLDRAGQGDLVSKYRNARMTIAKSYDVEAATDTNTGVVSARALARLADRGKPLSGSLKTIADVSRAFPKATQDTARFGGVEPYSAIDAMVGGHAAFTGNPGLLAMALGRPAVRELILSRLYQRGLLDRPTPRLSSLRDPNALMMLAPELTSQGAQQ